LIGNNQNENIHNIYPVERQKQMLDKIRIPSILLDQNDVQLFLSVLDKDKQASAPEPKPESKEEKKEENAGSEESEEDKKKREEEEAKKAEEEQKKKEEDKEKTELTLAVHFELLRVRNKAKIKIILAVDDYRSYDFTIKYFLNNKQFEKKINTDLRYKIY